MLNEIFTKRNIEILDLISKEKLHIRNIADKLECSPSKIHNAVKLFKKFGLVKEEKQKNRILITLNYENVILGHVRALINLNKILTSKAYKQLSKLGKIGIYGSYAKGTDDSGSDIDLLLYTDKKETEFRDIIRQLEKELGKQINLLIINNSKLKHLEKNDPEFYIRLKLTSTMLNGEIYDR